MWFLTVSRLSPCSNAPIRSRRSIEVEFASTEDKKLRNALRNPTAIEASVTSLQIASLKSVSKGSKIILLDRCAREWVSLTLRPGSFPVWRVWDGVLGARVARLVVASAGG